jgi:hypothetical protein
VKRQTVTKRPRAKADLLEHHVYIGEDNIDAADRFLAAAEAAFAKLASMPQMGEKGRSEAPLLPPPQPEPWTELENVRANGCDFVDVGRWDQERSR